MTPTLSQIWIYALKSAAGLQAQAAQVEPMGLSGDRRWMIVDPEGRMLSQRTCPQMALLTACTTPSGALHINTPAARWSGEVFVDIPSPTAAPAVEVEVWDDRVRALAASEIASSWLAGVLSRRCQLVYLPDDSVRPVDPAYAQPTDRVSFADGFPLLILSSATLQHLATLTPPPDTLPPNPVSDVRRFRPNLLIDGVPPYAEDTWKRIRIGGPAGVVLDIVKSCGRCGLINVNPDSAEVGSEPLKTLSSYRRDPDSGKVLFGQNAIPRSLGSIQVGQSIEVLA